MHIVCNLHVLHRTLLYNFIYSLYQLHTISAVYLTCNVAIIYFVVFHSTATIKFNQSVHSAAENDGRADPVIVLQSDVLGSSSIRVPVSITDGSAIGNHNIIILLYD